jgi:cytoskeletal protein CcmA (bactofilin family)
VVDRLADTDRDGADAARRHRIGQQVFREQGVQVQDGVAVEGDVFGRLHQEFDGRLVVEDHLRVGGGLAVGRLAALDQALRIDQRVGVPPDG